MPLSLLPRPLRRAIHRLLPATAVDVVYSPTYRRGHSAVPTDPWRGENILTYLAAEGLCSGKAPRIPNAASMCSLLRVHTAEYLESLRDGKTLQRIVGVEADDQAADELLDVQRHMAGGTNLAASLAVRQGHLAVHLGGGLHHAWADRGQGFCLVNDVAVAIASRRAHGFRGRILVVDLDLHHGDGTEAFFAQDASVYTYSIHNRNWATIDAVASTSIELGDEVEDGPYLQAIHDTLPQLVHSFRPDLAFYLAGADPALTDTLGDWRISEQALLERDLLVLSLLREPAPGIPTVLLLAGGYGGEAWRTTARTLGSWLSRGRLVEPPSTDDITLLRYREMAKLLKPEELSGLTEDWNLSEEDILGPLAGAPRRSRFLDYYSKHGIELVLERSGILERLRTLGFRDLRLEWNLGDEAGQTVRIFCGPGHQELLSELRARKERRLIQGFELLHVEWLLLQNPRESFSGEHRPLPGQEHPGLGLLREVVALLLLICRRLQLAGISFVPSHYHMAVTSTKLMSFLDPDKAHELAAVQRAVDGLSLAAASAAVEAGRVVEARTGQPYVWQPVPMVIPFQDELKQHLATLSSEAEPSSAPEFRLLPKPSP